MYSNSHENIRKPHLVQLDAFVKDARLTGAAQAVEKKIVPKLEDPGIAIQDEDSATVTLAAGQQLSDVTAMLTKRGLDPADWQIDRVTVNEWESGTVVDGDWITVTLHQLKVLLKPIMRLVKPARLDGPLYRPSARVVSDQAKLVVQLPDQQAPYHDRELHDFVCEWLARNRPDAVILSGDLYDFPSVSKYRKNLKMVTTAQQSIDAAYGIVRDYREATPMTPEWVLIPGNHEVRLENFLLDRGDQEIVELRRAGDGPEVSPVLSLNHLGRLDELGVQVASSPYGSYPYPHYELTPDFDIYHGWIVRPESGGSALGTIRKTGKSGGVGHSHRACIVHLNDPVRKLTGVEAGALAKIEGGLGYDVAPNWENAFAVYRVYPNGLVHPSLAIYRDGSLIHEGQRYYRDAVGIKVAA